MNRRELSERKVNAFQQIGKGGIIMQNQPQSFEGVLRVTQIIVGTLAAGVFFFMVVMLVLSGMQFQPMGAEAVISLVGAGIGVMAVPPRLLVPSLIVNSSVQRIARGTWTPGRQPMGQSPPETDEGKLLQVFLTKTIVGNAILEGAAFFNLVAFILEGQLYSLVLAVLLLLGILASFPTSAGLTDFLETQTRRVREVQGMKREP